MAPPPPQTQAARTTCIRRTQFSGQESYSTDLSLHFLANTAAHGGLRGSAATAAATQLCEGLSQLCLQLRC